MKKNILLFLFLCFSIVLKSGVVYFPFYHPFGSVHLGGGLYLNPFEDEKSSQPMMKNMIFFNQFSQR